HAGRKLATVAIEGRERALVIVAAAGGLHQRELGLDGGVGLALDGRLARPLRRHRTDRGRSLGFGERLGFGEPLGFGELLAGDDRSDLLSGIPAATAGRFASVGRTMPSRGCLLV